MQADHCIQTLRSFQVPNSKCKPAVAVCSRSFFTVYNNASATWNSVYTVYTANYLRPCSLNDEDLHLFSPQSRKCVRMYAPCAEDV